MCGKPARTDLCGGRWATTVPTATGSGYFGPHPPPLRSSVRATNGGTLEMPITTIARLLF